MKRNLIFILVCILCVACSKIGVHISDNVLLSKKSIENRIIGTWKYKHSYLGDSIHFYTNNEDQRPFFREIAFQKSKTMDMRCILQHIEYFHNEDKYVKPLKNIVCYHPELINWIGEYSFPILIRDSVFDIHNDTYIGERYKIEHCTINDTALIYDFEYYIVKLSQDSLFVSSSWNYPDVPVHLYCKMK